MKPDGKIQGVDVWVREWVGFGDDGQWCIANGDPKESTAWVNCDGSFSGDPEKEVMLFPSREAALAHLRKLEAKEKPVIDLSTAKTGDRFMQRNGKVSPPYGCPRCDINGWHIMQDGTMRHQHGKIGDNDLLEAQDLVAPYTQPRTVEYWVVMWSGSALEPPLVFGTMIEEEFHEQLRIIGEEKYCLYATRKLTLTEGEGLAEPDVA